MADNWLESYGAYRYWSLVESVYLLNGLQPRSDSDFKKIDMQSGGEVGRTYRRLKDAIVSNPPELPWLPGFSKWVGNARFCPREVITWAEQIGIVVPPELSAMVVRVTRQATSESQAANVATEIDFGMLATRQQLIDAFGPFTGLNMSWFDNQTDKPALWNARRIDGTSGRKSTQPLFCPFAVMQWLIDPKRKVGRPFSNDETAWRMLKTHFPKVYAANSIGDPRTD